MPATDPRLDGAIDVEEPLAWFGGLLGLGLQEVSDDPAVLEGGGRWAVVMNFEGPAVFARFESWQPCAAATLPGAWTGPAVESWSSSLDRDAYRAGVGSIRAAVSRGDVYQANLCRVLSAPLPDPGSCHPMALARLLAAGNPAPYAGALMLPEGSDGTRVAVTCASPELYLRRDGDYVLSRPIKGTAVTPEGLLDKDRAENVMIVDLVRNDLGVIARPGSVGVPEFLHVETHPGLVHLVSGVTARLRSGFGWPELIGATFPPGSVTGAPKSSALRIISALEPVPRGPYCGGIGWVDADRGVGELAVGIRSFWQTGSASAPMLNFGTGAGITWGSDADGEWSETELKAANLIAVAAGSGVSVGA